ncbi:MAG: HNH endonuclease [Phycisphaerae bacterium]
MNLTWKQLASLVETRANGRCEYCRMHQSLQGATFHVEHILPKSRGGPTDPENLCLCCPSCNLHKADRTEAQDPQTDDAAPLFHPRLQLWKEHFYWDKYRLMGITPTGRATVSVLNLNADRRIRIRQAEERFNLFPD